MTLFEKPEPIKIQIYLDDYQELVKKAGLYEELLAGNIILVRKFEEVLDNA